MPRYYLTMLVVAVMASPLVRKSMYKKLYKLISIEHETLREGNSEAHDLERFFVQVRI